MHEESQDAHHQQPQESQNQEVTMVEVAGKSYQLLAKESVKEQLAQNNILDGFLIKDFDIEYIEASLSGKVIIKNCYIERLQFPNTCKIFYLFENVVFAKTVHLGMSNSLRERIQFFDCVFEKGVECDQFKAQEDLIFKKCRFEGKVDIKNSRFMRSLVLADATFQDHFTIRFSQIDVLSLRGALCQKPLEIDNCQIGSLSAEALCLEEQSNILSCEFTGKVKCKELTAKNRGFVLTRNLFRDRTNFDLAEFHYKFVSKECIFEQAASWNKVHFYKDSSFTGSRFEQGLTFNGTTFHGGAYLNEIYCANAMFSESHFLDHVSFERINAQGSFLCFGVNFEKDVKFTFCQMEGRVSFSNTVFFRGKTDFYRGVFRGMVWFLGAYFQDVSFANATFEAQVFFCFDKNTLNERNRRGKNKKNKERELPLRYVSTFDGETNFTNTLFYRKAVFENAFFREFANFENSYFAEESNFENSFFCKGASFKGCFCSQELNFTSVVFDDYVNFDKANINRRLNLTDANIDKGISFYHAVIDVVVVEKEQIKGNLVYEGKVKGKENYQHYMRVKEEYLILKESFNQRGKFDEEDWAYYRYRVTERKAITQKSWRSLFNRPILPVQDEVTPQKIEAPEKLLTTLQKAWKNAEKKYSKEKEKLGKLQNRQAEMTSTESPNPEQLLYLRGQIHKQSKLLAELQNKAKSQHDCYLKQQQNMESEQLRIQKIRESKEKPYGKIESLIYIGKNALWKLVDWGTGYGMKPFQIGLVAVVVILCFASVYHFSQETYPGGKNSFVNWVYFSAMAFATSSPEGDIAYSEEIKFFIMSEALLGLFLMALFVGCYTRKIMR